MIVAAIQFTLGQSPCLSVEVYDADSNSSNDQTDDRDMTVSTSIEIVGGLLSGSVIDTVVPRSRTLSIVTLPPCSSTMLRTMASPRPKPPDQLERSF